MNTQGTVILSSSGEGAGPLINMFGATEASPEPGTAFFADNQAAGFTHFVEWQTLNDVTVGSINLFAHGDGSPREGFREFSEFRLFWFNPGTNSFNLLTTITPSSNPNMEHEFSATFGQVTTDRFRAEFDQFASGAGPAPRVLELDAFAIPEPSTAAYVALCGGLFATIRYRRRSRVT